MFAYLFIKTEQNRIQMPFWWDRFPEKHDEVNPDIDLTQYKWYIAWMLMERKPCTKNCTGCKKKTEKLFDKGIRDTHEILKTDTVLC